jgi:hypothetical protein
MDVPRAHLGTTECTFATARREPSTDAIRAGQGTDLSHNNDTRALCERLRPIVERFRALPDSGAAADKAFFDKLSGDL